MRARHRSIDRSVALSSILPDTALRIDDDGEMGTFDRYDGAFVDFSTSGTANPNPEDLKKIERIVADARRRKQGQRKRKESS